MPAGTDGRIAEGCVTRHAGARLKRPLIPNTQGPIPGSEPECGQSSSLRVSVHNRSRLVSESAKPMGYVDMVEKGWGGGWLRQGEEVYEFYTRAPGRNGCMQVAPLLPPPTLGVSTRHG